MCRNLICEQTYPYFLLAGHDHGVLLFGVLFGLVRRKGNKFCSPIHRSIDFQAFKYTSKNGLRKGEFLTEFSTVFTQKKKFYGWIALSGVSICHCILIGSFMLAFGVFLPAMNTDFGWTQRDSNQNE
jgi:hypothetical protein